MLLAGEVLFRQRVRASAPAGVAPEPPGDSGRIVWGFFSAAMRACFSFETESSTKASVRVVLSGEFGIMDSGVGARRGIEAVSLGTVRDGARGS